LTMPPNQLFLVGRREKSQLNSSWAIKEPPHATAQLEGGC
jgi:hypothetical protein